MKKLLQKLFFLCGILSGIGMHTVTHATFLDTFSSGLSGNNYVLNENNASFVQDGVLKSIQKGNSDINRLHTKWFSLGNSGVVIEYDFQSLPNNEYFMGGIKVLVENTPTDYRGLYETKHEFTKFYNNEYKTSLRNRIIGQYYNGSSWTSVTQTGGIHNAWVRHKIELNLLNNTISHTINGGKITKSVNLSAYAGKRIKLVLSPYGFGDNHKTFTDNLKVYDIGTVVGSNGLCGTAGKNYGYNATGFIGNYCSVGNIIGTPIFPARGQKTSWSCSGANGGNSVSCSATRDAKMVFASQSQMIRYYYLQYDANNKQTKITSQNKLTTKKYSPETKKQKDSGNEGDPVTLSNGEFTYHNTFMKGVGDKNHFEFTLNYKNQLSYTGVVGMNWDHNYNQYLSEEDNGNIMYFDGKLGVFRFINTGTGYAYNPGLSANLVQNPDTTWKLVFDNGNILSFGTDKKITSSKDIFGNMISFEYYDGLLKKVTDSQNKEYFYDYNSDLKLARITDFGGKKVELSYYDGISGTGSENDLKEVKMISGTQEKTVQFEYSLLPGQEHALTKLIDSKGQTYVENIYDTDRVVTQKFGNGEIHYSYTLSGGIVTENTVTDRENHVTKYEYDDGKNTRMSIMSGSGTQVYEYEYNSLGLISKEKRPRGNGYVFSYDAKGNLVEKRFKTDVDASNTANDIVTLMSYNSQNKLTSQTDALGNETTFEYDPLGNLLKISKTVNNELLETHSEYDTFGNLIKTTDPQGNITTFTYSGANLIQISKLAKERNGILGWFENDENDIRETFTYDQYGNILSKTDANGNQTTLTYNEFDNLISSLSPENILSTSLYDANNNVTQTISGTGGNVTTTEYNVLDKATQITKNIDGNLQNSISQEYDKNDNLTKIIFANGSFEEYLYNFANKVVTKKVCKDTLGAHCIVNHYEYDLNGNLIKMILPNNTFLTYEYDLFDRLIKETDALGNYKLMVYDKANRITTTQIWNAQNILVNETLFVYDEQNNLLETKVHDLEKNEFYTTINTYDKLGQLLTTQDALGHETTFEYDEFQRLVSQEDALENRQEFLYDKAGNILEKKLIQNNGKTTSTTYEYDKDKRVVKETNQLGKEKIYEYNELSQVKSIIDENGNTTHFEYNFAGQVKKQTQYLSPHPNPLPEGEGTQSIVLAYTYDEFGNKISATDENGNTTHFEYDTLHRLTKEIYPDNKTIEYLYDQYGNILTQTDPNGSIVTYVYDNFQRLIEKNITLGIGVVGTTKETFTYDEFGRLSEAKTFEGNTLTSTISFTYNALGQLTSETNNAETITYVYDALGQLIKTTYPNGRVVTKSYDEIGRVENILKDTISLVSYSYTGVSLSQELFQNGTKSTFEQDSLLRMSSATHTNSQNDVFKDYAYSYDDVGNILSNSEKNYGYDTLYRLSFEENIGNTLTQSFVYDDAGNRTDFVFGSGNVSYQSNLLNQYTSLSNSGVTNNFVYDNNGNLIEDETYKYKYDYKNKLVEVTRKAFTREISAGETTSSGTTLEFEENSQNEATTNLGESETGSGGENTGENSFSGTQNTPEETFSGSEIIQDTIPETFTDPENIESETSSGEILMPENEGDNTSSENSEITPPSEIHSGEILLPELLSSLDESLLTFSGSVENFSETQETSSGSENENTTQIETSSGSELGPEISSENTQEIVPEHTVAKYSYDAMGRRFEKIILNSSGSTIENISYVYSGEDVIVENKEIIPPPSGTPFPERETKTYYYGKEGIDDIIAFEEDDELHFYHKDHLGSITGITDESGSLVSSYDYDAYGNFTQSGTDIGNTRLFTGREFDFETGLYYYRARYYSAELGRFVSRDPIGITDDINLYAYVGNNPVMYRDPMGTEKSPIEQVASLSPHYDVGGVLGGVALGTVGLVTLDIDKVNAGNQAVDESMRNIFNPVKKIKKIEGVMKFTSKKQEQIVETIKTIDLTAGEKILRRKGKELDNFINEVKKNGITTPINYVEYLGKKYVVDGNHRLRAAKELKIETIPAIKVELPYKGFRNHNDLFY